MGPSVFLGWPLVQFERTLISANAPYDQYLKGQYVLSASEQRGLNLFMIGTSLTNGIRGANCAHCYGGPKLYQEVFHNNGLDSLLTNVGRQAVTGLAADRGCF